MPRTVAALYSSRAEAETAQARLRTQLQSASVDIFGQLTRDSLGRYRFSEEDQDHYRRALAAGDYLLCARVPDGEDPARIVRILEDSSSNASPVEADRESRRPNSFQDEPTSSAPPNEAALFVDDAWIARGGAKVLYSAPDGADPILSRSRYNPPGTSRFGQSELVAAGLLQDRTIEASEMGEVPVLTRHPVVREELLVRKTAEQREEVFRDTVRRTRTEVTDLGSGSSREPSAPGSKL